MAQSDPEREIVISITWQFSLLAYSCLWRRASLFILFLILLPHFSVSHQAFMHPYLGFILSNAVVSF